QPPPPRPRAGSEDRHQHRRPPDDRARPPALRCRAGKAGGGGAPARVEHATQGGGPAGAETIAFRLLGKTEASTAPNRGADEPAPPPERGSAARRPRGAVFPAQPRARRRGGPPHPPLARATARRSPRPAAAVASPRAPDGDPSPRSTTTRPPAPPAAGT